MVKHISKDQYNKWKKLSRKFPVSINNFYGDPTLQWEDTLNKLKNLLKTKHTGPVGIITKGKLTEYHACELATYREKGLNIILLISISELPQFEKIGMEFRYENIKLLNKYNIPNIAYIRPMTPPYNTSRKVIDLIFKKLSKAEAKVIVASGFRGDDMLVKDMSPDKKIEWTMRVKIMSNDVYKIFKENSEKHKMHFFIRTSCAVSYLSGDKVTYNPYYNSPNLVKCEELKCPLIKTCHPPKLPESDSLSFAKFLGYDVELIKGSDSNKCNVDPEKRLKCLSCCTSCYFTKTNRLLVKGKVNLGDITFIRFLTGMLAMQPGKNDGGDKNVGVVSFPNFSEIKGVQCLNTWWPYAHIGKKCFDCTYCVEKYYGTVRSKFGFPPTNLIDKIIKIKNNYD